MTSSVALLPLPVTLLTLTRVTSTFANPRLTSASITPTGSDVISFVTSGFSRYFRFPSTSSVALLPVSLLLTLTPLPFSPRRPEVTSSVTTSIMSRYFLVLVPVRRVRIGSVSEVVNGYRVRLTSSQRVHSLLLLQRFSMTIQFSNCRSVLSSH